MSWIGQTIKDAVDKVEEGVDKISKKTIGEIGSGIVESTVDAGTIIKKKIEDLGKGS